MKYQINENSCQSVVPVMELKPGEEGVIKWVGVYNDGSVMHFLKHAREYATILFDSFGVKSRKLAGYDDFDLHRLEAKSGFPFDELAELRDLEIEYRSRLTASPLPNGCLS